MHETSCRPTAYSWDHVLNKCSVSVNYLVRIVCVRADCLSVPSSLKVEPIGCLETSVTNLQATLHNIPEERRLHLYRGESLKSRLCVFCQFQYYFGFSIIVFVSPSLILPSFGNGTVESGRFPFFSND
jgi:hypothetical protein